MEKIEEEKKERIRKQVRTDECYLDEVEMRGRRLIT